MKAIACATLIEEMRPILPDGVVAEILDFSLPVRPSDLQAPLPGGRG